MDKKKVKELIENTIRFTKARDEEYIHGKVKSHIVNTLQVALEELSKSDWVSVEDGLPPYDERVYVCSKFNNRYTTAIRLNTGDYHYDNNGFLEWLHVTHWKPIEKLEE